MAVACGSDDDQRGPDLDTGGASAAGAPSSGEAGSVTAPGGAGGTGGSGSLGGSSGEPTTSGGAAGEPSAGAPPQGGIPNEPTEPGGVSTCGAQKYETGDGCEACPALPTPNSPTKLDCQSYSRAFKNNEDLELGFAQVIFHEPLGGAVTITWEDVNHTLDGSAEVPWTFSPTAKQLYFDLPTEARYADTWRLTGWTFTDVCGFLFTASDLTIRYDGEAYSCVPPT